MAGRSLQALSLALRRAGVAAGSCFNNIDTRFVSQVVGGQCPSYASSPWWRIGSTLGNFDGYSAPASFRKFSPVGTYKLGSLAVLCPEHSGSAGAGLVSYSSLALESRDESYSNESDIGYKVLGPFVSDGSKVKPRAAFAVVQVGSHQFKVSPGDMIYTEKLKHADINDELSLNKVLLLGSLKQTIIGRPIIPEAAVIAAVEEHALDAKVIVFKKKRRKNYRRTNGHRQELTRLRILRIEGIEDNIQ